MWNPPVNDENKLLLENAVCMDGREDDYEDEIFTRQMHLMENLMSLGMMTPEDVEMFRNECKQQQQTRRDTLSTDEKTPPLVDSTNATAKEQQEIDDIEANEVKDAGKGEELQKESQTDSKPLGGIRYNIGGGYKGRENWLKNLPFSPLPIHAEPEEKSGAFYDRLVMNILLGMICLLWNVLAIVQNESTGFGNGFLLGSLLGFSMILCRLLSWRMRPVPYATFSWMTTLMHLNISLIVLVEQIFVVYVHAGGKAEVLFQAFEDKWPTPFCSILIRYTTVNVVLMFTVLCYSCFLCIIGYFEWKSLVFKRKPRRDVKPRMMLIRRVPVSADEHDRVCNYCHPVVIDGKIDKQAEKMRELPEDVIIERF